MPFYKKIERPDFKIGIWQITEQLDFFKKRFSATIQIQNENKQLQWYASRHLLNEMLGTLSEIMKDETGKPVLKNSSAQISVSHTANFAAVMLSDNFSVGVDLETINPKIVRVAGKFLREDEISAIAREEKIEKLILYWSAKESLYKFYSKGKIDFTSELLIAPFELKANGELNAEIRAKDVRLKSLKINYEFFGGHVLTYVVGR
jgi:phosphopantetheinyl transferase